MDEKQVRTRKILWYDRKNDKWEIIDEIVEDLIIEIPEENVRHYLYGNGDTKTEKIWKDKE